MTSFDWPGTIGALANSIFAAMLVFWSIKTIRSLPGRNFWTLYGLALVGVYVFGLYIVIAFQEATSTFTSSSMTVYVRPAFTAMIGVVVSGLIQMARGLKQ